MPKEYSPMEETAGLLRASKGESKVKVTTSPFSDAVGRFLAGETLVGVTEIILVNGKDCVGEAPNFLRFTSTETDVPSPAKYITADVNN